MSAHFNALTGQFLLSEQLIPAGNGQFYDLSNGNIVFGDLLVPKLGKTLFDDATLDLNFAENLSLTDSVSGKSLVTFTRASSGTYVGSDGLIKTSPVNRRINSEEIDTFSLTQVTATANQFEAPDGTFTADRVDITTADSTHFVTIGASTGTTTTTSVYVKAISNVTEVQLVKRVTGGRGSVVFDLVNGTSESALVGNITFVDSSITSAGNGWYRISITATSTGDNVAPAELYFTDGNADAYDDRNGQTFVGTNESIAVWGVQVEEGLVMNDYIPTTSTISGAARFDHDPATGESLGLLIEESRTNALISSEVFNTSPWIAFDAITSNADVAPNGAMAATRVSAGRIEHRSLTYQANTTYTLSVYAKGTAGQTLGFGRFVSGEDSDVVLSYTALTGNWQRLTYTFTSPVTASGSRFVISGANDKLGTATNYLIWGAQLEEGSFPTSYIPTSGTTVTRAADVAEITGANFAKTNLLQYSDFNYEGWVETGTVPTVQWHGFTDPEGNNTAAKITFAGAFNSQIQQNLAANSLASGQVYTYSVYAKAVSGTQDFYLFVYDGADYQQSFTATTDWQRFSFTHTGAANANPSVRIRAVSPSGGEELLVWGAQLEEGSVLTDYTPSVESFDSRASSATYVDDETGLIKTAPVNLTTYSESFDDLVRSTTATNCSVSAADIAIAPNGKLAAEKITVNAGPAASTRIAGANISVANGSTYTSSFYIKPDGFRYAGVFELNSSSGAGYVVFDLDTDTCVSAQNGANTSQGTSTSVGNGWHRITYTYTSTSTSNNPRIYVFDDSSGLNGATGDGSKGFYIWGAQLEEGTTATPYIKTTSTISGAARYENGELLLEEARTNYCIDSEDPAGWTVANGASKQILTAVTAPDGSTLTQGFRLPDAGSRVYPTISSPGTVVPVSSCYVRSVSGTATLNLFIQGLGVASNISVPSDRWLRISGTKVSGTVTAFSVRGNSSQSEDVYIWGAQLEEGSYPTSYIPTSGTTVTRAADVSTSALGVDSWYNQSEGTVFVDRTFNINNGHAYYVADSTLTNDRFRLQATTHSGDNSSDGSFFNLAAAGSKTALAIKTDNVAVSANGSSVLSDTSYTLPSTMDRLLIGQHPTVSSQLNGHIKRLAYFPVRKTDEELQELTS